MDAGILSSISTSTSILGALAGALFWLAGLEYRQRHCKARQDSSEARLEKHITANFADHDRLSRDFAAKIDDLKESFSESEKIWQSIDKSQAVIQADLKNTLGMFARIEREHSKQLDEIFLRLREIETRGTK